MIRPALHPVLIHAALHNLQTSKFEQEAGLAAHKIPRINENDANSEGNGAQPS